MKKNVTVETYLALLRGINVGGHKPVNMEELKKLFESLKFENVKTLINSGNVAFDSDEIKTETLSKKIKEKISTNLGYKVETFVLGIKTIEEILRLNPFRKIKKGDTAYVTFLPSGLTAPKLPLKSQNGDFEVLLIKNSAAFSVSRRVNGKSGYPNIFLEKTLKVPATTRNWNTINKIVRY